MPTAAQTPPADASHAVARSTGPLPRRLEALVGFDATTSDAFDATWQRFNSGINWYFNGHRLKVSVMHRESFNDRGAGDQRSRATYLQTQFSF
jgi:hypothetical protein